MWVLGTEPRSSGKVASDINSRALSLTSAQNLEASIDLVLLYSMKYVLLSVSLQKRRLRVLKDQTLHFTAGRTGVQLLDASTDDAFYYLHHTEYWTFVFQEDFK